MFLKIRRVREKLIPVHIFDTASLWCESTITFRVKEDNFSINYWAARSKLNFHFPLCVRLFVYFCHNRVASAHNLPKLCS